MHQLKITKNKKLYYVAILPHIVIILLANNIEEVLLFSVFTKLRLLLVLIIKRLHTKKKFKKQRKHTKLA